MTAEFEQLREHLDSGLALDPVNQRVVDSKGGTMGYWQPVKSKVTGLLTVIFYNETDSSEDHLLELARYEVDEHRDELASEGWEVVDDGAVARSPDDWDERFVMFEIVKQVASVEVAADAIRTLADCHFEYEV